MTDTPALSFGEELRRERVVREIPLEEIAAATKISLRLLTALEMSDLSRLPAPTFTRGFIRAYARHIGIDPDEKVNAYLADLSGGNPEAPSAKSARPRARFWRGRRSTAGMIVGGVAGVLLVLGLIANPQRASRKPLARVAPPAASVAFHNVGVSSEPTPIIRQDAAAPAPAPAAVVAAAVLAVVTAAPVPEVSRKPAALVPGLVSLVLEFDDDSWTKLDADGRTVFSGLLRRGERKTFEAREGFRISLGNAGAVRVTVDGRALARLGQSGEVVRDLRLPGPPARGLKALPHQTYPRLANSDSSEPGNSSRCCARAMPRVSSGNSPPGACCPSTPTIRCGRCSPSRTTRTPTLRTRRGRGWPAHGAR